MLEPGRMTQPQVQIPCPVAIGQCRPDLHRRVPGPSSSWPAVPRDGACGIILSTQSLILQVHGTMAKILASFVIVVSQAASQL